MKVWLVSIAKLVMETHVSVLALALRLEDDFVVMSLRYLSDGLGFLPILLHHVAYLERWLAGEIKRCSNSNISGTNESAMIKALI